MCLGFLDLEEAEEVLAMAGYLGPLDSFHSFRGDKRRCGGNPLAVLMFFFRPGRNVYHLEQPLRGSQLGS